MSEPYYQDEWVTLHHGDCLNVLASLPDASVDAVVTDPPYGLRFMGKAWDGADIVARTKLRRGQAAMPDDGRSGKNGGCRSLSAEAGKYDLSANAAFGAWCLEWTSQCLRALKPGGHMLAFGGSRTWHRLACAAEDAGFEVRDSIAWLHGQGFPKSLDVDKAIDKAAGFAGASRGRTWQGWGTALKPAFEPCIVARKPLASTVAANVLAHGTGALNIDACRIATTDPLPPSGGDPQQQGIYGAGYLGVSSGRSAQLGARWPANVILDESQADVLDEQSGQSQSRIGSPRGAASGDGWGMTETGAEYDDIGGASRFFYTAKASTAERIRHDGTAHPTVKPLDLMRWLVRLVTPPGGVVLEPFAGSGTTVEACLLEGFHCVAIEREADYLPLIQQRLSRRRDPVEYLRTAGDDLGLFGDDVA